MNLREPCYVKLRETDAPPWARPGCPINAKICRASLAACAATAPTDLGRLDRDKLARREAACPRTQRMDHPGHLMPARSGKGDHPAPGITATVAVEVRATNSGRNDPYASFALAGNGNGDTLDADIANPAEHGPAHYEHALHSGQRPSAVAR